MSGSKGVLVAAVLFAATGVLGTPTATADEPKVKKPEPAAGPGKTIVIQIDASKIPPDVLKELIKLSQAGPTKPVVKPDVKPGAKPDAKPGIKPDAKPGTKTVKTITLSDAIAIAEKLTKGTAVKAEREDEDGEVEFEIEVADGKGGKTEVVIDGNGKVLESKKKGEKEEKDEKGKKKDDDKGKKKKSDD